MVDALHSKCSIERCEGSSPSGGTEYYKKFGIKYTSTKSNLNPVEKYNTFLVGVQNNADWCNA